MVKRLLTLFSTLFFLSAAASAYSVEGLYVEGLLGAAWLTDSDISEAGGNAEISYENGALFGIAMGYQLNMFRVEAELSYMQNDIDDTTANGVSYDSIGDVSGTAAMFNAYYDFQTSSAITPYLTAGLGWAWVEVEDFNIPGSNQGDFTEDDSVFAYQVGLGAVYEVVENLFFDLRYRYFATEDAEFNTNEVEIGSHQAILGLRYNF